MTDGVVVWLAESRQPQCRPPFRDQESQCVSAQ